MSKLKKVTIISKEDNKEPKFIKTMFIRAEREGKEFTWEVTKQMDSVHILIDNIETKEIILVKQVRVPVLLNDTSNNGEMIELCAGLVDKDCSLEQIAKEEVLEEIGYNVPVENIKLKRKLKSSVGTSGTTSYLYTTEITENMKVSEGGGLESEDIEIIKVPYSNVESFIGQLTHIDAITLYAIKEWQIDNVLREIKNKIEKKG
jgi:UDP-sugar diphosphatase